MALPSLSLRKALAGRRAARGRCGLDSGCEVTADRPQHSEESLMVAGGGGSAPAAMLGAQGSCFPRVVADISVVGCGRGAVSSPGRMLFSCLTVTLFPTTVSKLYLNVRKKV